MSYILIFAGVSYRKVEWVDEGILVETRPALVHAYHKKVMNGTSPVDRTGHQDGMHPEWRVVEKVFSDRVARGRTQYFVKWYMLGYQESTWEFEEDLASEAVRTPHLVDLLDAITCRIIYFD